jgi:PAS domain-containing protein
VIEFFKKIPGLRSSIGRRFILYILLFSSVITFMGTGLQLYFDYDRELKAIHATVKQIKSSYLDSITNSLWVTDDELLRIQLEGILRLPDMQLIEVRKGAELLQVIGSPQTESIVEQTIPLDYVYNGRDVHLGELHVVASLKGVYARIFDRVVVILIIQTIKTFLVSLFIFIIFYQLVGKYIVSMASFVESMRFESMDQPLHLNRKLKTKKPDELDKLVTSFNGMRENLARDITRREIAEKELRKSENRFRALYNNSPDMYMFLFHPAMPVSCNVTRRF